MANPEPLIFGLAKTHYRSMVQVFDRYPQIEKVLIFGSRAKGTAKPYSDFDLAVFAPSMSTKEFASLWSDVDDLPIIFKIDLLHWDSLSNLLLKNKILKDGKKFHPIELE